MEAAVKITYSPEAHDVVLTRRAKNDKKLFAGFFS